MTDFQTACRKLGESPAGVEFDRAWFARRRGDGGWMIVGVYPQGSDDHGRPGALAFHGLFVDRWAYALAGADPFPLVDLTRGDWTAADCDRDLPGRAARDPGGASAARDGLRCLINRFGAIENRKSKIENPKIEDPLIDTVVRALARRRPVVILASRPIDDLVRGVWRALPWWTRSRLSAASWAFDNANRFDLVALPKIEGASLAPGSLIFDR